jgi:hypothetical protein
MRISATTLEHPMITRPRAATLIMLAATATACAACAISHPPSSHPPSGQRHPAASARRPDPPSCPAVLLPVSPPGLQAAAALAARFAAAYDTRRPGEPPGAWLARLTPMATSQLAAALARTAATPALWPPGQATAAQAGAEQIRDLTPASVIFTVQVRESVTTSAGRAAATDDLAVTVIRDGSGWAVYDIEPAAAGNAG